MDQAADVVAVDVVAVDVVAADVALRKSQPRVSGRMEPAAPEPLTC